MQPDHAAISFDLFAVDTLTIIGNILSGRFDAGLCFSPIRHPDLSQVEIWRGRQKIVVKKGHPLLRLKESERIKRLAEYPAVFHRVLSGHDIEPYQTSLRKSGITPKIRTFVDNGDLAVSMVLNGLYWSILPEIICEGPIVNLKSPPGWEAPISVQFVTSIDREKSPVIQDLIKRLVTIVRQ